MDVRRFKAFPGAEDIVDVMFLMASPNELLWDKPFTAVCRLEKSLPMSVDLTLKAVIFCGNMLIKLERLSRNGGKIK